MTVSEKPAILSNCFVPTGENIHLGLLLSLDPLTPESDDMSTTGHDIFGAMGLLSHAFQHVPAEQAYIRERVNREIIHFSLSNDLKYVSPEVLSLAVAFASLVSDPNTSPHDKSVLIDIKTEAVDSDLRLKLISIPDSEVGIYDISSKTDFGDGFGFALQLIDTISTQLGDEKWMTVREKARDASERYNRFASSAKIPAELQLFAAACAALMSKFAKVEK